MRARPPGVVSGLPNITLTNILIYANARGQLERRTEWDDKNAARNAKAEHEGKDTVVKPPVAPKEPTQPPTPRPPKEPTKPRPTPMARAT